MNTTSSPSNIEAAQRYRYPGSQSFQDSDIDRMLFYGRAEEASELFHAILKDSLTLLTGKSGLGKTSLLHASIFPQLREEGYVVLTARFNRQPSPRQSVVASITERFASDCQSHGLDIEEGDREKTLWEYLKTTFVWLDDKLLRPIIVCDQFEEIFTTQSAEQRSAIMEAFGPIVRGVMPDSVRELFTGESRPPFTEKPPDVKVVFSLRHEYVALLETFSTSIPKILDNLFLLKPLSKEAARESITMPALVNDDNFLCPSFSFSNTELSNILDYLGVEDGKDGFGSGVEPFRLQLICRHIERRLIDLHQQYKEDTPQMYVPATFLGGPDGMKQVEAQFYADALRSLPSRSDTFKAQKLCEKGLISSRGNENRRITVEIDSLKGEYDIDDSLIDTLERERILKREMIRDQVLLELSHDSLIAPVLDAQRNQSQTIRNRCFAGAAAAGIAFIAALVVWTGHRVEGDSSKLQQASSKLQQASKEIKVLEEKNKYNTQYAEQRVAQVTKQADLQSYSRSNLQTIVDDGLRLKKDLNEFIINEAPHYQDKDLLLEALRVRLDITQGGMQSALSFEDQGDYLSARKAWNATYRSLLEDPNADFSNPPTIDKLIRCFTRAVYWNWNLGHHEESLEMSKEIRSLIGYSLELKSVSTLEDLNKEGRALIIVAYVGDDLHIRTFDATGEVVVDASEKSLLENSELSAFIESLNEGDFPDEDSYTSGGQDDIKNRAISISNAAVNDQCDLRLMSVANVNDLPGEGISLIVIANLGNDSVNLDTDLHLRIFDEFGRRVIDGTVNSFLKDTKLKEIEEIFSSGTFPDDSSFSMESKQQIIENISALTGHQTVLNSLPNDHALACHINLVILEAKASKNPILSQSDIDAVIDSLPRKDPKQRVRMQSRLAALLISSKNPKNLSEQDWALIDRILPQLSPSNPNTRPELAELPSLQDNSSTQDLLIYADAFFWNGRAHLEAFHTLGKEAPDGKSLAAAQVLFERVLSVNRPKPSWWEQVVSRESAPERNFALRELKLRHQWALMGLALTEARQSRLKQAQEHLKLLSITSEEPETWALWELSVIRAQWLRGALGSSNMQRNYFLKALAGIDELRQNRRFPAFYSWWEDSIGEQSLPEQEPRNALHFTNSLGMKFISLPSPTQGRISIWETRVGDYRKFSEETKRPSKATYRFIPPNPNDKSSVWKRPDNPDSDWKTLYEVYNQNENHPVIGISHADAKAFCEWLTMKEGKFYRLPTMDDYRLVAGESNFSWGTDWPPPTIVGNFGGKELGNVVGPPENPKDNLQTFDYVDSHVVTAPVQSFRSSIGGVYDLGGNVREWLAGDTLQTFGGSWIDVSRQSLQLAASQSRGKDEGQAFIGFRVVLDDIAE